MNKILDEKETKRFYGEHFTPNKSYRIIYGQNAT